MSRKPIDAVLKPLARCATQAYLSNALQVADVLEWILAQFGTAEVWHSSFSISEEFVRRLFFIQKNFPVSAYHLILDLKATNKTVRLWPFISRVAADTALADNHSKLLLVRAADGRVCSVITSQNLTRGNRLESACITTEHEVFVALLDQFQDTINNHSVPLDDILRQRFDAD